MSNTINDEIVTAARALYDAGLNVFPIRFASKNPFGSTSMLTTARIHLSLIELLFADSNIGIMTGRLSQNLFVIDCDSDASFEEIGVQLASRGMTAWVRLGYRGGQYWMRCAEGEVRNENFGDVQILGNRLFTAAPPSLHPEGVFYHWGKKEGDLPPSVSIQDMKFLGLSLASGSRRDVKRDKTTLPPVAHRVLVENDTTGYHSNSEAEFAACLSLISSGMPDAMIGQVFASFNPPHYAKSRGRSFNKYTLEKAHSWLDVKRQEESAQDRKFDFPHSDQFRAYADSRPWPGRTGNTDKAVYLALCTRMQMDRGSRVFRASVRELSELANVGTQAVQASVNRLKAAKLLKYESRDDVSNACLYSLIFREEMSVITTVGEAYTGVPDSVVINAIQDDAFHTRGLGKSAYAVWKLLLDRGNAVTVKEIIAATGRAHGTVTANLAKLAAVGMARKEDEKKSTRLRWIGCEASQERLQEIAEELGTSGKAAKRKALHLEERQKRVSHILLEQKRRVLNRRRPA